MNVRAVSQGKWSQSRGLTEVALWRENATSAFKLRRIELHNDSDLPFEYDFVLTPLQEMSEATGPTDYHSTDLQRNIS